VTLLLPLLGFVFVSLLVTAAAMALAPSGPGVIEQRLGEMAGSAAQGALRESDKGLDKVIGLLKVVGSRAPRSTTEVGKLQQRLVTAGYRGSEALPIFLGLRIGVALLMFALFGSPLAIRPNFFLALAASGLGYVMPGMVLARMAKRRQHKIRLGLPDALDLLVVSVEAGLGLDQAILRVSDELAFAHPELAEEMRLINLELRAGKGRSEALHNFGERTQVDDVTSLVAMLVQTDKFGTSVAQSLRVHADTSRTKRRQRAEEAAAKTGVKMVFPLVFCIFPAIWIVTIGPAAIKFVQVLGPLTQSMK
jgi:tight adherence protein C